jgi:hypothetical protein
MDQLGSWKKEKMNKRMAWVSSGQSETELGLCRSIDPDGERPSLLDVGGRFCFFFGLAPWCCGFGVEFYLGVGTGT